MGVTGFGHGRGGNIERRRRVRVPLHCPVRLHRRGYAQAVEGETRDLSSIGFYCVVAEAFYLGDDLDCVLTIPAQQFSSGPGNIDLHCESRVARVESLPSGSGLGCHIEHYSLVIRQPATE